MKEIDPVTPPGSRKPSKSAVSASAPNVPRIAKVECGPGGRVRNMTIPVINARSVTTCTYVLMRITP